MTICSCFALFTVHRSDQATARARSEAFSGKGLNYLCDLPCSILLKQSGQPQLQRKSMSLGFGVFLLSIPTLNQCPLLVKPVQLPEKLFISDVRIHFSFGSFHSGVTHALLWEQYLPPDVQHSSPISWDGGSSYISHPSLSHHVLSVAPTLLSTSCSSECLAADTTQGCLFPSRIAQRLLPWTL